jgi:single-stranded DNA-binding protein
MFTSTITIEGRLAEDANPVSENLTEFVVLTNRRGQDEAGEWSNTDTSRYVVKAFKSKAKKTADLKSGTPVVVAGSIVTDKWESGEGSNRYQQVVLANAIGLSL